MVFVRAPQTLIAGISPVLIGTALSAKSAPISWWVFTLCLLFTASLQIGTNWANDYFDFVKGADTENRKAPPSALQTGGMVPRKMLNALLPPVLPPPSSPCRSFIRIGWIFFPLTLFASFCHFLYRRQESSRLYRFRRSSRLPFLRPRRHLHDRLQPDSLLSHWIPRRIHHSRLSLRCHFMRKQLRDIDEDLRANKMTLVARLGKRFGQIEYALCLAAPFFQLFYCHPSGIRKASI